MENAVTKKEKFSYGMYFMGQNVFYGQIGRASCRERV